MEKRPFVHVEIPANDPAAAAEFYSSIFGWETEHDENMDYTMFDNGGVGGGFNRLGEQVGVGDVIVYIGSGDIDADLAAIKAAGGDTVVPKTEIPNIGWFAWFKDPTGNTLALYTPKEGGM